MSLSTLSGREAELAGPPEALPVDPFPLRSEAHASNRAEPSTVRLRVSLPQFRDREVVDPSEEQSQQLFDDEVAGRIGQAQALFDAAPGSAVAASRYAHALMMDGKYEEAGEVAAAALAREMHENSGPASVAHFVAARVLASVGRTDEAERALGGLPSDGPWAVLAASLADGRGDTAEALHRLEGVNSADANEYVGYLQLKSSNPQSALRHLRAAQRQGASGPTLLLNQAFAYALLGSQRKAVKAARQAAALAPLDLTTSFYLVNYLRVAGLAQAALEELRRIAAALGDLPSIMSARADVLLSLGRTAEATRELRRAIHHTDDPERSPEQAELRANIALLDWLQGQQTREECLAIVLEQIESVGPRPSLVAMVADLATTVTQAAVVDAYLRQMSVDESETDLLPIAFRLAFLRSDYVLAAELCARWAEAAPLDVQAARNAVVHLGQSLGDYERAANVGLRYLQRLPNDSMLLNNVAFVLALAGRPDEAARVLRKVKDENAFLVATRGLVQFARRDPKGGLDGYDRAEELCRAQSRNQQETDDFIAMLRAQETLVIHHFGLQESPLVPERLKVLALPEGWASDPRFLQFAAIATREGVQWLEKSS